MAKKKSKNKTLNLVLLFVVIGLAVLTICTLFMPVFTTKTTAIGSTGKSYIKGWEVIGGMFKGEYSFDYSSGVNSIISLRAAEDTAAVTNIFCWVYFLTLVVSAAVLVFAILKMLKFKFKLVNTVLAGVLVVLAILTFIFGFVVASKMGSFDISVAGFKAYASVASYLMLAAAVCGATHFYLARQK